MNVSGEGDWRNPSRSPHVPQCSAQYQYLGRVYSAPARGPVSYPGPVQQWDPLHRMIRHGTAGKSHHMQAR